MDRRTCSRDGLLQEARSGLLGKARLRASNCFHERTVNHATFTLFLSGQVNISEESGDAPVLSAIQQPRHYSSALKGNKFLWSAALGSICFYSNRRRFGFRYPGNDCRSTAPHLIWSAPPSTRKLLSSNRRRFGFGTTLMSGCRIQSAAECS